MRGRPNRAMLGNVRTTSVIAAVLALVLPACGGSDDGALENYFASVVDIREARDDGMEQLQQDLVAQMGEAPNKKQEATAFVQGLRASTQVDRSALGQLQLLDPPDTAREAHETFIRAYEAGIQAVEAAMEPEQGKLSLDELFTRLGGGEAVRATEQLGQACAALQDVADDHEVAADLQCSVGEAGTTGASSPTG